MLDDPYFGLLEALARMLRGLDPAAFPDVQSLEIGGRRVHLFLEPDQHDRAEDRIVLRCEVVQLPAAASEAMCRLLLRANNLLTGTRGATLGLLGHDVVLLSVSARILSLDAARLATLITGLLRQAERWAARIIRAEAEPSAAEPLSSFLRA